MKMKNQMITDQADGGGALDDKKPEGKLIASDKLSLWIQQQLASAAEYVPFRGGRCKLCGRFCRTNNTSASGVRYHRCTHCGITFKTVGQKPEKD
jgi:hypothetical protein